MIWKFDQTPNVACITCQAVMDGHTVLVATHYDVDHCWAFLDGAPTNTAKPLVVAMSEVVERHPDLEEIASLPPGWSATRASVGHPWIRQRGDWDAEG